MQTHHQDAAVEDEDDVIFLGSVLSAERDCFSGVKERAVMREDGELSTSENSMAPVVVERNEKRVSEKVTFYLANIFYKKI